MNQALILAALTLMLLIPALVTAAALLPLGRADGAAATFAHRLGISRAATTDLQALFSNKSAVQGATTTLSAIVTVISAFAWPATLMRGYELAWGLPRPGMRALWRPLLWLPVVVGLVALAAALGPGFSGWGAVAMLLLVAFPILLVWAWWSQHLLLCGRVPWRELLPGAIATAGALCALRLILALFFSKSITSNYNRYGPIGVVFSLLTWFIAFSVIMLGGAVVGREIRLLRSGRRQRQAG